MKENEVIQPKKIQNVGMATGFTMRRVAAALIGGVFSVANVFHPGKKFMPLILVLVIFCLGQLREECFSEAYKLNKEETVVLESFFKALFWNSEGGYVFFDKKPLCINGFVDEDLSISDTEHHFNSVSLKEGAKIWKKLSPFNKGNLILHIYEHPDSLVSNCYHVLFINKKLLLQAIQQNLSLFQYILGPNVTPDSLLTSLIDPEKKFYEVLKEDKALIGILLGFGVQSSLFVSRIEDLQEAYFKASEEIPLKGRYLTTTNFKSLRNLFLWSSIDPSIDKSILKPTFSYLTLQEEVDHLSSQIEVSSTKLVSQKPNFMFGRVSKDKKMASLVKELESTQEEIKKFLSSEGWLEDVLERLITTDKVEIAKADEMRLLGFNDEETLDLEDIVAKHIWKVIQNENDTFIDSCFKGMEDAHFNVKNTFSSDGFYDHLVALKNAKENVDAADSFFKELDQDKQFSAIEKGKLYIRTNKTSESSSVLKDEGKITFHCKVVTPSEQILLDTNTNGEKPLSYYLKDLIPGLSLGLNGMKVGETREIFIHPLFAYGIYTTLEKGIYLKVEVELLSIDSSETFTPMIQESFDPEVFKLAKLDKFNEISSEEGYQRGYNLWMHYKNSSLYSFPSILEALKRARASKETVLLTKKDKELMNRLHWNIYHTNRKFM